MKPIPCRLCGQPATIGTKDGRVLCLACHLKTPGTHHTKNPKGHLNSKEAPRERNH